MADYLTRLVERTLGLSPVVRPTVPPTFAPEIIDTSTEPATEPVPATVKNPPRGSGHRVSDRTGPFGDEGPHPEEHRGIPSPTEDIPARRIGPPAERDAIPSETPYADKRAEIEHFPTEDGRRPSPAATRRIGREAGDSETAPNPRETPSFGPRSNHPETARDGDGHTEEASPEVQDGFRPEAATAREEHPAESSEMDARSAGFPGAERSETDDTTSPLLPREAQTSGTRRTPSTATDPRKRAVDTGWAEDYLPITTTPEREDRRPSIGPPVPDAEVAERPSAPVASAHEGRRATTAGRSRTTPPPMATAASGERGVPEEGSSPTIRVSIGRVEVRAVAPGSEPVLRPAGAERPPVLSLDDYLKNGGRR